MDEKDPQAERSVNHGVQGRRGWQLLALSFSALGVIYGDIGTSPLYAYQAVFTTAPSPQQVLSAASLFFWTLTLIVLLKYVGIVLRFDDNGEGGTFALYALICRAAGFGPFGPAQPVDMHFKGAAAAVLGLLPPSLARGHFWSLQSSSVGAKLRRWYRGSHTAQVSLLVVIILATAMVVGDGVLTPSISVLSAVSGLHIAFPSIQTPTVVGVSVAVLVLLFSVQHQGTSKISSVFAPVIAAWLLFNAALGLYNLSTCGWGVWEAISPHHALAAFLGPDGFVSGWRLLAGVMLCITGAEAMYADLGHFNARAVVLSFCAFVYPLLAITYMGQASYLLAHPEAFVDPFWMSVPRQAFWPMLVVATAASVVASQALISGVFSIMRQAMMLGVLPRLKVIHTDAAAEGQIYIPQINYMLMLGCVAMVAGFQDTTALGHAYGVAVITVMFITTILSGLVMLVCYDINPALVTLFVLLFVPLEGLFLSSNAIKVPEGGWVTIMIAALFACLKLVWWYGSLQKRRWLVGQAEKNSHLLKLLPLDDADDAAANTADAAAAPKHRTASQQRPAVKASRGLSAQSAPVDVVLSPVLEQQQWRLQDASNGRGQAAGVDASGAHEAFAAMPAAPQPPAAAGAAAAQRSRSATAEAARRRQSLASLSAPHASSSGVAEDGLGVAHGQMSFKDTPLARVPGLAIIYTQSTSGLPAVLAHLLANMPALHQVAVLLTIRFTPLPYVMENQRFLVRHSRSIPGVYRVVVRYGYMEEISQGQQFVRRLVGCLARYAAAEDHQQGQQQQPQDNKLAPQQAAAAADRLSAASRAGKALIDIHSSSAVAAAAARDSAAGGETCGAEQQQPGQRVPQQAVLGDWRGMSGSLEDEAALVSIMSAELQEVSAPEQVAVQLARLSAPFPRPQHLLQHRRPEHSLHVVSMPLRQQCQLGRESINRQQHRQHRKRLQTAASLEGEASLTPFSSLQEEAPTVSSFVAAADAAGAAAGGLELHTVLQVQDSIEAGPAATGSGSRQLAHGSGPATSSSLSKQQLEEIELLLDCYRQRAVHVVGDTRIVGARPGQGLLQLLHCAAVAGYQLLDNNKQPATAAWQIREEQLLEVALTVRL